LRILLDTHVVLWALVDSPRLPSRARSLLADADNECWVSSASVWETAIKAALGRMGEGFSLDRLEEAIASACFRTLDVTIRHAVAIGQVDVPQADLFDRLLVAQCEVETLRLLTADEVLSRLPVAIRC
jgi:PIN domain nuclease of toxin-antitoxin system